MNCAATLAGRTSVNLNYTVGRAGMESAARQAGLRSLVTSRAFVAKAKLELPDGVEPLWIEDLAAAIGRGARLQALALALLAPVRLLEQICGAGRRPGLDDVATIIFSSGSTGDPKGVLLTHFNLGSNLEAVAQVFPFEATDRFLRKGEQLAVLHTLDEAGIPEILRKVAASGLSNLLIPRRDRFVKVDRLPVLGTGKLDLRGVKRVVLERLASRTGRP